ncbi:HAD-IC family P-type ATPase [Reichenbachiella sp. MALMAid0571]|uniref:cation-translocating P-type ATPase n=1 Tax=Reichenbachiella sp. MALMAid0571 TaxID=3143939 RepID=UPI0032DF4FA4
MITKAYSLNIDQAFTKLDSNQLGLNETEANKRLAIYGPNELPETKTASLWLLILKQFRSWLVIVLILAAIISWQAGEMIDTWVILAVIVVNAAIGFFHELRAEKAIASLRKMIVKVAKVIRGGHLLTVPTSQLVPGDVIVLEEGDSIPADARVFHSNNLRVVEAALTGESLPVSKSTEPFPENTPLIDQENMAFKGTFVVGGYGKALVTDTGIHTAIGDISQSLGEIKTSRSNFMKKTDILARQMAIIAVVSAVTLLLVGYFIRDFEIREILLVSIAALVAAIPEGLPAVISIVLAIGANRMAKKKAIIREFTATETLGSVTAILTDKTGTLTQNSLTVRKVYTPGKPDLMVTGEGWFPAGNFHRQERIIDSETDAQLQQLLKVAALSNNSEITHNHKTDTHELVGDPTEGALLVLAKKGGMRPEKFRQFKLDDLPFDSKDKLRATLVDEGNNPELYVVGAPEVVLSRSESILMPEGEQPITEDEIEEIQAKIAEWSDSAMRVIALAHRQQNTKKIDPDQINQLVFLGLVGMLDPPRPDAREAVHKCKEAGIRVIMVTGDHINTAVAIAKSTGIIEEKNQDAVKALTEQQLLNLDEDEFDDAINNISVFARLTPRMKLRIAGRLQAMGHLIAMTGDGVNDAPALKQADVGVSMGIMGTDVARDSSDVVLSDDNFATIVNAVEEGRIVFTNSRQTSFFLVTTNIAESVTLVLAIALGLPLPLLATQILWLNLVTDGVTDMALATEPGHGKIMQSTPLKRNENILNRSVLPFLVINVVIMAGLSLATFYYYLDEGVEIARTGVFSIMAFTQLFNVFNLRSIDRSIFAIGMFSNRYINLAVGLSVILLIMVTEVPGLASIFHFQSLRILDFIILFALSSSVLWVGEFYKFIKKWSTK